MDAEDVEVAQKDFIKSREDRGRHDNSLQVCKGLSQSGKA